MSDPAKYDAAQVRASRSDESVLQSVDLSRPTFKRRLIDAATGARDFARSFVSNALPDDIAYVVRLCCSYDGNPRREDERVFPEDYGTEPITTTSPEEVTAILWRDGFVPEWINVTVTHEDGARTYVELKCCGRFSAKPEMMYHIWEGRPPFHVLGPALPPEFDRDQPAKFDLYWQQRPGCC
jgi:hypothetical protein